MVSRVRVRVRVKARVRVKFRLIISVGQCQIGFCSSTNLVWTPQIRLLREHQHV